MKTLKLKAEGLGAEKVLTKEELKKTLGHYPSELASSGVEGCNASIECEYGPDIACACVNMPGTCTSTTNSVDCECSDGTRLTATCSEPGSGGGSGSGDPWPPIPGSGSGSGSSPWPWPPGSGSGSGGSPGSGSGSGSIVWVEVNNITTNPVPIYIDNIEYFCPVGVHFIPQPFSPGIHQFYFPCIYLGMPLKYLINGSMAPCGSYITENLNANITINISY